MKAIKVTLPLLLILTMTFASPATVLFSDPLNYPNGCIETDGLWFAESSSPLYNTAVYNDLLILTNNGGGQDTVAAPTNGLDNTSGSTELFASFTINVSKVPSAAGNYFSDLMQTSTNGYSDYADVCRIFADATGTNAPGTYRLGIANYTNIIAGVGATNFPMDLATGVTYQVVVCFGQNNDPLEGATIWINPSSENDNNYYATDNGGTSQQQAIYDTISNITAIEFSPYVNAAIGNVRVGTQFSDVDNNTSFSPVFGIQPQSTTNYSGNNIALYGVASGIDVSYQWLSNNVPLVGAQSETLSLSNLQNTANYSIVASSADGSITSTVATVTVNITPTAPIFTVVPPTLATNFVDQTFTLSVAAVGTGPISYQWYFAPTNLPLVYQPINVTTPNYTITLANSNNAGTYYVTAYSPAGTNNSQPFSIEIVQPPLVTIGSLHSYITLADENTGTEAGGELFDIQGVVTTIGQIFYGGTHDPSYGLYFVQDGTGGCAVFTELTATNNPSVGSLVNVVTPVESYYGNLEMAYYEGGTITLLSTNNPLPAPQLLNFGLATTNPLSSYSSNIECSLVSITNVYLSTSAKTYTAPTADFPTNGSVTLYAWPSNTTYPGETNLEVEVYTYTNSTDLVNTNYYGKPIPSYCYQITGIIYVYNPPLELVPSRYQDFVTTLPPKFSTTLAVTNSAPTLSWLAVVGSTYSVYSATNIQGPWTQTFGLAYYPSVGSYTDTNPAPLKFYKISSP